MHECIAQPLHALRRRFDAEREVTGEPEPTHWADWSMLDQQNRGVRLRQGDWDKRPRNLEQEIHQRDTSEARGSDYSDISSRLDL
jgi:hypothetical protein